MRRSATALLAASLVLGTATTVVAAEPAPSEPPAALGPTVSDGRTETPGSGFAITFPEDWTVDFADPDTDVFDAHPGTAWEALRATAPDGHMACSLAVGVAEVPFFQPPERAGSGTGQGGVGAPFWDPDEPHLLWVPEPVVPDTHSSMQTTWDRLQDQGEGLAGDAAYSLLCMTSDANDAEPGGTFMQLMDTFEFLPAEGEVRAKTPAPPSETRSPRTCKQMKKAFRQGFTTGDAHDDEAYLTRCVTCDEMFDLVRFMRVADIEMGKAILSERCDWPRVAEPSPSGQRVEVADAGIVAWVPAGWTVMTITDEPDLGFIQVGLDRYGAGAEMRPIFVALQPEQPGETRQRGCSLAWYGPLALTPDEALAALWGDQPIVTLESLDGQMSRASLEDPLSPGTHHEQYALDAGDAIAILWCGSSEPRKDDWYSIARSIQFTTATESTDDSP